MPAKTVDVTVVPESIEREVGATPARIVFSLTYQFDEPLEALLKVVAEPDVAKWVTISGPVERTLTQDTTTQVTVDVAIPAGTASGDKSFRLAIVGRQNPDEDYTESPAVRVVARQPSEPSKKAFPIWILAVVAAVVIAIGIGLFFAFQGLGHGDACEPEDDCGELLTCHGSRCLGAVGYTCTASTACADLACESGKCAIPIPTDVGAACVEGRCGPSLECTDAPAAEGEGTERVCLRVTGGPCVSDGECVKGFCVHDLCADEPLPSQALDACTTECGPGLECMVPPTGHPKFGDPRMCLLVNGGECRKDEQCISGICTRGTCVQPVPEGLHESCSNSCGGNLECVRRGTKRECLAKVGGACNADADCVNEICEDAKCVTRRTPGKLDAPCLPNSVCLGRLVCHPNKCVVPPPARRPPASMNQRITGGKVSAVQGRRLSTSRIISKLSVSTVSACKQRCEMDERCKAFTFGRTSAFDKNYLCYLLPSGQSSASNPLWVSGAKFEQHYAFPHQGSFLLDLCRTWGRDCGKPAADLWCQRKGFRRSIQTTTRANVGNVASTQIVGDGKTCSFDHCDAFASVRCGM